MAQGTFLTFEEFSLNIGNETHNLGTGAFSAMLINNTLSPTVATSSPDSALFTEVSGTGYTAGGIALTTTWTETGGLASFKVTNNPITWTLNGAGPIDIYYAIIFNNSASSTDAVGFIDMTADGGTTPLSLRDADVVINFDANGIFNLTKN